jgi:flagellar basal-body rod protein FlgB
MGALDNALGVSPQALALRAQRTEILSANIANANTPGYKARDIDFSAAMQTAMDQQGSGLRRTDPRHLPAAGAGGSGADLMYRLPAQPSLDGNTVESHREHAEFMDNAVRYQASLGFLDSRIRSLQTAIRGQQ